jgi:hypothetical protein
MEYQILSQQQQHMTDSSKLATLVKAEIHLPTLSLFYLVLYLAFLEQQTKSMQKENELRSININDFNNLNNQDIM